MADRSVKVYLRGDISDYNRAMLGAAAGTKAFVRELDSSNDRMSNLVQTSLALGPALVPIAASAVPVLAGLTNQLALAGGAAGVALLAFSGVGDALKATNEYAIEPSTANLEKMQEAMAKLGPAGRSFVAYLQELRPQLQGLQDEAQAGLFPGVVAGIDDLLTRQPDVERLVGTVSRTAGQLIAEAGDNLADPRWDEFFDFLDTEGRTTLLEFGRTIGNLTEGFAELWMAFQPVSSDFSRSFLEMSRDFSQWADGLDQTEGFQDFVEYLDETGPMAWDALGALSGAILEVAEAAAPVGAVALPIIEALADSVSAIADTDAGPVLIATAAGVSAVSRAIAVYNAAQGSQLAGLLGRSSFGGAAAAAKELPAASRAYLDFGAALDSSGPKVGKYATTTDRLLASLGGGAKIAAGIGGLALVVSDLDEQLGLSNTAMLTLAGSALGPFGAGIGAAAGFVLDLVSANNSLWESLDRVDDALQLGPDGLEAQNAALEDARRKIEETQEAFESFRFYDIKNAFLSTKDSVEGLFGDSDIEEAQAELAVLEEQYGDNVRAAQELMFEEAGVGDAMRGTSDATREQAEETLELVDAHNKLSETLLASRDANRAYEQAIDDANERFEKRKELQEELANAESPEDAERIRKELEDYTSTLDTNTQAGRDNEEALDRIAAAWNELSADQQNAAGASDRARREFINVAVQMGATRAEAEALADEYLDIPTLVPTTVDLRAEKAKSDLASLLTTLRNVEGRNWVTDIIINTTRRSYGDDAGNEARAPKKATGGSIVGQGTGTSDSIPIWASNGEHMWTAAEVAAAGGHGAVERIRAAVLAGGVRGYATGGAIGDDAVSKLDLVRLRIRVRDIIKQLNETEKYKNKAGVELTRPVLRGIYRTAAKLELQEAREEYETQRRINARVPRGMSYEKYNEIIEERREKAEERKAAAKAAAEEKKRARQSAAESFLPSLSSGAARSVESLERELQRMVVESAEFISLLAQLDRKGASAALLDRLEQFGPSKSTNRTMRALLKDTAAFKRINSLSTRATRLADVYGSLTTNSRFLGSGAAGLTGAQRELLSSSKTLKVQLDGNYLSREVARLVTHELSSQQGGAVLPTS